MLWHTIILHPVLQLQDQSMVPISLAFNADLGTISKRTVLTTTALTATGQPPGHNQSVCPEQECGLCREKGHIITNCPFDDDWDNNDVIKNEGHARD